MSHQGKRALGLWCDPNSNNLGVAALARGLKYSLPPDVTLVYASHLKPINGFPLSVSSIAKELVKPKSRLIEYMRGFDIVIDLGEGDSFTSIYGVKRMLKMMLSKLLVFRAGIPLVLAPQTLGPFSTRGSRFFGKVVLKNAQAVWARDSDSKARAQQLVSRSVKLATDLAFALPMPDSTSHGEQPGVLLNVSGLLWHPNAHVDFLEYRTFVHAIFRVLVQRGETFAILAHVISADGPDDDSRIARELAEQFQVRAVVPQSLDEARTAIQSSKLVVASRMHACLNAVSLGVPTIALAYSDKFHALFDDLGLQCTVDLRGVGREEEPVTPLLESLGFAVEMTARSQDIAHQRIANFRASLLEILN